MKAKKKPHGIKHKIREVRKKEERTGLAIIVAILVTIIFISGFLINSMLNQPSSSQPVNSTSEPKTAIVDHLSLTYANQTFIETATAILKQAGYTVDYYPSEDVTVEFFRNLATHNYGIIILRVHSSASSIQEGQRVEAPVAFFTSESYSETKYVYEQLTDQLTYVAYSQEEHEKGISYFGIDPRFVTESMKGRFQDTIIIVMGCEGLSNTKMAKAFVEKGARVYIGFNGSVLASYTDSATTHLLQHFIVEKLTLKEAVIETFKEVSFDPVYNSLMIYYPVDTGNYTIQNIAGNLSTTGIKIQHKVLIFKKREIYNLQTRA